MHLLKLLTEQADAQQQVLELIAVLKQATKFIEGRNNDGAAWFYRGVSSGIPNELLGIGTTRPDRPPSDTNLELHQMLDDRLLKDFGHRYRSDATFVVGDRSMASDYGRVCIILPMGDFDFIYSKKVKDAYGLLRARRLRTYIEQRAPELGIDMKTSPKQYGTKAEEIDFLNWVHSDPKTEDLFHKWFEETYRSFDYTKGTVEDACLSQNEIMLYSKQYAFVPYWARVPDDIVLAARSITKNESRFNPAAGTVSTAQFINSLILSIREMQ